jgi:hypothetical protein
MAARSAHVQLNVESMPNTQIVLVGSGLSGGEWSSGLQPPAALTGMAGTTSIEWQSESDGFLTGTQGWVRYYPVTPGGRAPASPPDEDTIFMTWDVPYDGVNSYASSAPQPYKISGGTILDYNADNDSAVFELSFVGELQTSNTAPALCYFAPAPEGGQLVLAYVGTNKSNDLFVTTTDTLGTWSQGNPVTGQRSQIAPALTEASNGQLALAYIANNGSGDLLVTLSKDSVNWSSSNRVQGQSSSVGPGITTFNNELVLVYIANNGTNDLLFATSATGTNWSNSKAVKGQQSPYTPAVTVLGDELYIAYVANNGSNDLIVTKTKDLTHWTATTISGQTSPMGPALAAYNGNLVMVYIAENGSLDLIATRSRDGGATWTPGMVLSGQQGSPMTPALATFTGPLVLAYVSNDSSQRLIVSTSTDGINWQSGTNLTGP